MWRWRGNLSRDFCVIRNWFVERSFKCEISWKLINLSLFSKKILSYPLNNLKTSWRFSSSTPLETSYLHSCTPFNRQSPQHYSIYHRGNFFWCSIMQIIITAFFLSSCILDQRAHNCTFLIISRWMLIELKQRLESSEFLFIKIHDILENDRWRPNAMHRQMQVTINQNSAESSQQKR